MAAMAAALTTRNWAWISSSPRLNQQRWYHDLPARFGIHPGATSSKPLVFSARASPSSPEPEPEPRREGADADNSNAPFLSQEDLDYLIKLGAGSVAGAAAIKYGSIVFPRITHPNLTQALLMIIAPVVIALWLLIRQSRGDNSD